MPFVGGDSSVRGVKLTFPLPHTLELPALIQPWESAVTGAQQKQAMKRADELGYDMISVPEHFVIPRAHVELSGPFYFDATAAQGVIAGATERARIGSTITLLPLQHPVVMAKALSTIDWLSGGRMTVAFGVGWLKEEFDAIGVPFEKRGKLADEYLEAIIELWTAEWATYKGEYVSFEDMAFAPKPVQKPHLPIWMGGDSDAALRRTARFATGWIPFLTHPNDLPGRLEFIKSQPTYREVPGQPFEVSCSLSALKIGEGHVPLDNEDSKMGTSVQEIVDKINWLEQLGATITNAPIPPVGSFEEYLEKAQWVMEEIKPHI